MSQNSFFSSVSLSSFFFPFCLFGVFIFSGCSLSSQQNTPPLVNTSSHSSETTDQGNSKNSIPEEDPLLALVRESRENGEIGGNKENENTKNTKNIKNSVLKKLVEQEQKNALVKNASLDWKVLSEDEKMITLAVAVKNPDKKSLQSVQAWLLYPKTILKGKKITRKSRESFPLVAPLENDFDNENGIVRLGFSAEGENLSTSEHIVVAEITFEKISSSPFQFDWMGGKTKVMTLTPNGVRNILK